MIVYGNANMDRTLLMGSISQNIPFVISVMQPILIVFVGTRQTPMLFAGSGDERIISIIIMGILLAITIIFAGLYHRIQRYIMYEWLKRALKRHVMYEHLLFEEIILRELFKGQEAILEFLDIQEAKGYFHSDRIRAYKFGIKHLETPRDLYDKKSLPEQLTLGYTPYKDSLKLLGIIGVCALLLTYGKKGIAFMSSLLLLFYTKNSIIRLYNYWRGTYLSIDLHGLLSSEFDGKILWEDLEFMILRKIHDRFNHTKHRYELVLVKKKQANQRKEDRILFINIMPYNGGWRSVYFSLKKYAPIPLKLQFIDRLKEIRKQATKNTR